MKKQYPADVFDQFFNNSIDLLCIANTNGYFTKLNSEWESTLGYSLTEMEGKRFIEFVHPDDVENTIYATEQLANDQRVQNFVNRYKHKNGSYRWIEWRSYPTENMIFASARDITKHIETEQALRESEERNKLITSMTTDYVFKLRITEKKGYDLEYLSENFESITGLKRLDVFSTEGRQKIFHPDDFPKVQRLIGQMISDGLPGELECRSIIKGNTRWINIVARPEKDPSTGEVVSITGAIKDITARKKAEMDRQSSEDLFLKALVNTPDSVSISNCATGKYVYVNDKYLEKTGYELHEVIGKTPLDLNIWADLDRRDEMLNLLKTDKSIHDFETRFRMKSGQIDDCVVFAEIVEVNQEKHFLFFVRDITDRKKSEEALRQSEQKYRLLFENMTSGFALHEMIYDENGKPFDYRYIEANPAFEKLTGLSAESIIGKTIKELVPTIEDQWIQTFGNVALTGEPITYMNYAKDLGRYYDTYVFSPEKDKYAVVFNDATVRINAENALTDSEEKFRSIVENSLAGIFTIDEEYHFIYVNDELCRLLGYSKNELIGMDFRKVLTPNSMNLVVDRYIRRKQGEDLPSHYEFEVVCRDGRIRQAEMIVNLMKDNGGKKRTMGQFIDITERKHAENVLRESESRLRSFINESSEGIVIINEDGLIEEWNNSAVAITGISCEEAVTHTWWDVQLKIAPEDRRVNMPKEELEKKVRDTLSSGELQMPAHDEYQIRHANGETKHLEHNLCTIKTEKGYRIAGIFDDITRRKNAEESLNQARILTDALLESAPGLVYIYNQDNLLERWNKKHETDTGYSAEELFHMNVLDWFKGSDSDIASINAGLSTIYSKGFGSAEAYLQKKDGEKTLYYFTAVLTIIDGKNYFTGIGIDITERKLAEEALRQSEEKFSLAFKTSPDAININRLSDGLFLEINQGFTESIGYSWEDINGKTSTEIDIWANPSDRSRLIQELTTNGKVTNLEAPFRHKDGRIIVGLMSASIILLQGEKCIISITRDISKRKLAEEQLKRNEARLQRAQDLGQMGYSEQLIGAEETWASANGMSVYGFPAVEGYISNEKIIQCLADFPLFAKAYRDLIGQGKKFDIEYPINPADGSSQRYIHAVAELEKDKYGNPIKILSVFQDVSTRKQAEIALRKRVLALTKPMDDPEGIKFTELFDIEELQKIQDTFAAATGVSSLITSLDGTPLTKPSNFCTLCDLIRSTEKGSNNCKRYDATLGISNVSGPTIQSCLSAGLQGAGASIIIGGVHMANWLIGQVRDETINEKELLQYADEIGIDRKKFRQALNEIPVMSKEQFKKVAQSLFVLASELSLKAYQNIQQARFISEQQKAEEALRMSEEQFRGITQNIPGMVFQFYASNSGEFGLSYVSDLSYKYLGLENKNIEGILERFAAGLDEEERTRFYSSIRAAVSSVSQWEWEGKYTKPDGEKKHIRGVSQPRMIGNQLVFDGVILDITERKSAEEALRQSEERLRGITQNIPGIVYQLVENKEGISKFSYITDNTMNYAGLDSHDPDLLQHFFERLGEEDRNNFFISRQKAVESMSSWEWEGEYTHPNGETKYFRGLSHPRLLNDELTFDGIISDITKIKLAEKELAYTRALLTTAIMQAPIPMAVVSAPDYIIRLTNKACSEILGLENETSYIGTSLLEINQTWQDFDEFGNPVPITQMPLALALGGIETKNKVCYIKRRDGAIRWESVSSTPVRNDAGEIIAAYLVFPDITEHKIAEEALYKNSREMEWLMKSMANAFVMWDIVFNENKEIIDVRYAYINDTYERFAGVKLDQVRGKSIMEVFPHTGQSWFDVFNEIINNRKPKSFEMFFSETNALYACTAYLPWDTTDRICVIYDDITERRRAEEQFRQLARLHQTILDTASAGLLFVKNRMMQWANMSFYRMFGYENEMKFETDTSILYATEDEFTRIGDEGYRHLSVGEVYTTEALAKRKDDKVFWIELSGKAVNPQKPEEGSIWMIVDITKRKTTEEEFIQLAGLNQTILDTVSVGLTYVQDRHMHWANNALLKMFGFRSTETFGAPTSVLYSSREEYKRVGTEAYSIMAKGEVYSTEILAKRKDKSKFWVSMLGKSIDPNRPMEGSIWMLQDITERKNSENALKRSEAVLKATMESIDDGLLIVLDDGSIMHSNDRFSKLFNLPNKLLKHNNDELLFMHVKKQLVDPKQFTDRINDIYLTLFPSMDILNFNDGRIIERLSFPLAEDSPVKGRVWLFRDITERKNSEEALIKNQKFLSESQRIAHIGCWEIDLVTKKIIWNEETYQIYGYEFNEIEPSDELLFQSVHPDDRSVFASLYEELMQTNIFKDREYRIVCPDGKVKTVLVVGAVSLNNENKPYRTFGIIQDITERKVAEIAIREQDAKLKSIFLAAPVAIGLTINRNFQECNDAFYLMTGYTPGEIIGKNARLIYPTEEDFQYVGREQIRQIKELTTDTIETCWLCKDRRILNILLRFVALDQTDFSKGVTFIALDITERKNAEEALRRSEESLAKAQHTARIGSMEIDLETETGYFSEEMYNLFGFDPGKGVPKINDFLQFIHPDDRHLIIDNNKLRKASKRFRTFEYRSNPANGPVRYFLSNNEMVYNPTNKSRKLIATIQDITERKLAEDQFKESEQKFRIAFENAPSGMSMIKPDGQYVAVNPMLCDMFGYKAKELLAGKINKITHPDDIERSYAWIKKIISGDMSEPEFEKRYIHKDGHIVWGLVRSQWIRNKDGSPQMSVTHILDITERKKAEEEIKLLNKELEKKVVERTIKLNEAIKDLEAFAYSVSHDLRAPIRHIDGFLKLMYSKIPKPKESITDYYNKIEAASQRMSSMIDSLLSFSRLGRKELTITEIDLESLVYEIIDQFKPDIGKRKIKWNISKLPQIQGDKNLIKLVLENLLSNAIKYTSKKEKAMIEIGSGPKTENQYEIYVKDNGIGFDMAYSDKLFGVFQRLHTSDDFEGVGIGLANVKQIIEKHKGSVRAEGKINKGAAFYITLPKNK